MQKIIVEIKSAYGEQRVYPVCEKAKIFAELIQQKTFTKADIERIKKLGVSIIVEQPEVKL